MTDDGEEAVLFEPGTTGSEDLPLRPHGPSNTSGVFLVLGQAEERPPCRTHWNIADHIRFLRGMRCGLTLMQPETRPERGEVPISPKGGYRDLIALVLEREMGVVGKEQAIETAKGVAGLEVDERGNALAVKGDGKEILGRLLLKYHERFGSWAVLNCKMSLRAAAREYGLELPKILGDKEGK